MHSWTFGSTVTTITAAPVCNSDRAKERPVSFNNKSPLISTAGILLLTADTREKRCTENKEDTVTVGWTNVKTFSDLLLLPSLQLF